MALYGISGSHTTEAYPLNNSENVKRILDAERLGMGGIVQKYRINKILE